MVQTISAPPRPRAVRISDRAIISGGQLYLADTRTPTGRDRAVGEQVTIAGAQYRRARCDRATVADLLHAHEAAASAARALWTGGAR